MLEIIRDAANVFAKEDCAEINAGALVGYCTSLSAQGQTDVSESLLFAQLAADASKDKFTSAREWIDQLIVILEMVGWRVLQETSHGRKTLPTAKNWKALAIDAFEKGYGGPAPLVARTMKAASEMGQGTAGAKLWNSHACRASKGVFLLGHVNSDGSGDPLLFLMPASFEVSHNPKAILDWDSAGTWADDFLVLTLNSDVYDLSLIHI